MSCYRLIDSCFSASSSHCLSGLCLALLSDFFSGIGAQQRSSWAMWVARSSVPFLLDFFAVNQLVSSSRSLTGFLTCLGDALITVLRRFATGRPLFQAHRQHLFQRLNQAGWSHAQVAFTYFLATSLLSLFLFTAGLKAVLLVLFFEVAVACWLDLRVAVPLVIRTFILLSVEAFLLSLSVSPHLLFTSKPPYLLPSFPYDDCDSPSDLAL